MTGNELIRRLRGIGREHGVKVRVNELKGKGSHALTTVLRTTLKDRREEIRPGLLKAMLRQRRL
jgi:mRNA interferase HicA